MTSSEPRSTHFKGLGHAAELHKEMTKLATEASGAEVIPLSPNELSPRRILIIHQMLGANQSDKDQNVAYC
jgi:hypothetical protein